MTGSNETSEVEFTKGENGTVVMSIVGEESDEPETRPEIVESDEAFIEVELPVYAHRSGKPVIIGASVVTRYKDRVEIAMRLDNADGLEMGGLLTTSVEGLTLGGVLDPELARRLT
jgi:hypothetical protein